MASISKDSNGTKRVVYYNAEQKQVSIRLGKISKKMADTVKVHIENLLVAQSKAVTLATETARWLTAIDDNLHQKLVQKKLVAPRKVIGTLIEVIPKIIKEKSIEAKPATIEIWRQSEKSLYLHFGENRRVDKITEQEAKEFRVWLSKHGRLKDKGPLKQSTVAKRMQHVNSFFLAMKEKGDIPKNPFKGLAEKAVTNDERNEYIDEETILQVMEYAPDAEWRLIIALWRFSGLRAASEVLSLKWEHILWDQNAIMVHAPKTERHAGKDIRKIPFFPHMKNALREAFEQADEGSIYVVEKHAPLYLRGLKERTYISRQGNLGTVFKKIILRAGIVPWKKLIHNLRASFETDLLNGKHGNFGPHVIAYWLGHSVKVMLEHYGRIQKADYDKIAQACLEVEQRNNKASLKPELGLSQNNGFNAENMESAASNRASLKASWYTAVGGEITRNGAE